MPITEQLAVDYGFLVAFAEEMYVPGAVTPHDEPRIAQAGWDVIGHFLAFDSVLPNPSSKQAGVPATIQLGQRVFYGFLARNHADPTRYAAAIRGTSGFAEWAIDADFLPLALPAPAGATVEKGFWSIYASMTFIDLQGGPIGAKAADGIATAVGAGTVTVCGHSLGSAIATYLSFDVAKLMGNRASACLFASPRTGNHAWATAYAAEVSTYRLTNYLLDVVPYVPFDAPPAFQYSTLPGAQILKPSTAQADVKFDIRCNHNLICYCAMIDWADTKRRASAQDIEAWRCILGPPAFGLNRELTLALEKPVIALGGAVKEIVNLIDVTARTKGGHV